MKSKQTLNNGNFFFFEKMGFCLFAGVKQNKYVAQHVEENRRNRAAE